MLLLGVQYAWKYFTHGVNEFYSTYVCIHKCSWSKSKPKFPSRRSIKSVTTTRTSNSLSLDEITLQGHVSQRAGNQNHGDPSVPHDSAREG